jgi:transcriptional regulator with XRE-family HTH domain
MSDTERKSITEKFIEAYLTRIPVEDREYLLKTLDKSSIKPSIIEDLRNIPYAVPLEESKDDESQENDDKVRAGPVNRKLYFEWREKSIEDERQTELKAFVERYLAKLSSQDRELFESKAIYNLSDKEISAQRGASVNKIRTDYERIRERLERDMSTDIKKFRPLGVRISEEISEVKIMNVKQLRELTGLTQTEFATRVNTSRNYIAQIETGVRKPNASLKAKINEAVLAELVYKRRLEITTKQRLDESFELYHKLSRILRIDKLVETRMLALDIDARNEIPIPVNGALALYIWTERLNKGLLVDLVLLDTYKLEDKSIISNQPVKALKYVEAEVGARGIECPKCFGMSPLEKIKEAEDILDVKWRCKDCAYEFFTREAWNIDNRS